MRMDLKRIISLVVGGVATLATMVGCMAVLLFGRDYQAHERIIVGSIALAPVALISAMAGYAVWWAVMFLMSLFVPDNTPEAKP